MLAERLPGLLPDLSRRRGARGHLHPLAARPAGGRRAAGHATAVLRAAPHRHRAVTGGRRERHRRAGSDHAWPIAGFCSSTRLRSFPARALDALRQPLESGTVTISRARGVTTYPARFLLRPRRQPVPLLAKGGGHRVASTASARPRRSGRTSVGCRDRCSTGSMFGPGCSRSAAPCCTAGRTGEPTAAIRARVEDARARSAARLQGTAVDGPTPRCRVRTCAGTGRSRSMRWRSSTEISTVTPCPREGSTGCMKVAWTVADLAGHDRPDSDDVAAARALRFGARPAGSLQDIPMPARIA